ncbi:GNAT family N-acetyltransferase [soil metagenome]
MIRSVKHGPTRPLKKSDDRKSFDCGVEALNLYLSQYALQNQKKDASRTYVAVDADDKILGYYTLVYGGVTVSEAPPEVGAGFGNYPVPILLIARLAVSIDEAGKGLGRSLLRDALIRAIGAADIAGLSAVVVDAKDSGAKAFYEKLGFIPGPEDKFRLFRKMTDIRSASRK